MPLKARWKFAKKLKINWNFSSNQTKAGGGLRLLFFFRGEGVDRDFWFPTQEVLRDIRNRRWNIVMPRPQFGSAQLLVFPESMSEWSAFVPFSQWAIPDSISTRSGGTSQLKELWMAQMSSYTQETTKAEGRINWKKFKQVLSQSGQLGLVYFD